MIDPTTVTTRPMADRNVVLDHVVEQTFVVVLDSSQIMLDWHGPTTCPADIERIEGRLSHYREYGHLPADCTWTTARLTELELFDLWQAAKEIRRARRGLA